MQLSKQTLEDLEFPEILENIATFSFNDKTAQYIRELRPYEDHQLLIRDLNITNEYLSSYESENRIPFSEFYYMSDFLPRLNIENYYLDVDQFFKIKSNSIQIRELTKFFNEFQEYFPELHQVISKINYENEIVKEIDNVFNKHGEIKNSASSDLADIRHKIKNTNSKIADLFRKAITQNADYLDDIKETIVDNKRVLAVNSGMRKRVKGKLLGTSKTGSISFIEPQSVYQPYRELEELKDKEYKEIIKILKKLTAIIAVHKETLENYEVLLEYLDFTQSKARFAQKIKGVLPNIKPENKLNLIDAYHPLLYLKNSEKNIETIPQTLSINGNQRIIIISGPNAGGKSITLKTIGLNQLMIQSGILIPVHSNSEIGFFNKIFTDIGDNQSIENQLSTYSYRLKQMSFFIRNVDKDTLLLIDEFGTGSDPELGGALAEVFFEEFYERSAFGIFTTHYSNIKIIAEELPHAINASMLFNEKTLSPLYKLEIGQAGSSFTFEVAEKNKIPYRLINRAKKKVEKDKIRLDKTILKLQQEKFEIQKTKNQVKELQQNSVEQNKELENTQEKLKEKLVEFQQLYDSELKNLRTGKKINEWADEYLKTKNKKKLINNFIKWVEIENSKKNIPNKLEEKKKKITQRRVQKELNKNRENIEKIKEQIKRKKEKEIKKSIEKLKIGDRVKIKDSNSIGTIEKIQNETITINYGQFLAKISIFDIQKI